MVEEKRMADYFSQCAEQGIMADFSEEEIKGVTRLLDRWAIKEHHKLLEPGCGSGRLTGLLARKLGHQGEILAMDLAEGMIQKARAKQLTGPVYFEVGSVSMVKKPDNWFDKIICFNVFPHFTDIPVVLKEFSRLLKNNGELWINHLKSRETINAFHQTLGHEVCRHVVLEDDELKAYLKHANFALDVLENDEEHGYCVKALKRQD